MTTLSLGSAYVFALLHADADCDIKQIVRLACEDPDSSFCCNNEESGIVWREGQADSKS